MSKANTGNIPNEKRLALLVQELEDAQYYSLKLNGGRNPLKERLRSDNKELRKRLSGQIIPNIIFGFEHKINPETNEKYRIILGSSRNDTEKYAQEICSSHTVVALQQSDKSIDVSQCGSDYCDCIMTFNDVTGLDIIIRAIALDIQTSHALHQIKDWTANKKRLFSKKKASFINASACPNYVCFALNYVVFNNVGGHHTFDYDGYVEKCLEFVEWYVEDNKPDRSLLSNRSVIDRANDMLFDHPNRQQISPRKVAVQLSELQETGTYVLARLSRRPKKSKNRKVILNLFNGNRLRVGLIKIVHIRRKSEFERYSHYIQLHYFDFVKE